MTKKNSTENIMKKEVIIHTNYDGEEQYVMYNEGGGSVGRKMRRNGKTRRKIKMENTVERKIMLGKRKKIKP